MSNKNENSLNNDGGVAGSVVRRKKSKEQEHVEALLAKITADVTVPDGFQLSWRGVRSKALEARITDAPFVVRCQVADPDGTGRTLFITGLNTEYQVVSTEVPFNLIYSNPGQLASILSGIGIRVRYDAGRELARYINAFLDLPILTRVVRPGWVCDPGDKLVFALRDRVIGGDGYDLSRLAGNPLLAALESKGTLAEWIEHVATPAGEHPVVAFSLMVAFASPLLRLLNADGFGALLRAQSSKGKTTSLLVMASVFGRAIGTASAGDGSFVLTFNATINAIEASCAARNDVGLALDEVGMFDGQAFTTMAYRLAGGISKSRLGRDGKLRDSTSWQFVYLCSGERSVQEMLAEDQRGGRVRAGQLVRLMNIETNDNIITANSMEEANAEALALRAAVSKYFGTAGPVFIETLIDYLNDPREDDFTIDMLRAEWDELTQELMVPGIEAHQQRAVRNFALVALGGILGCLFDILPYEREDVLICVKTVRDMYLASGSTSDAALAARRLRDHMIENADRFEDVLSERQRTRHHAGDYWTVNGIRYFLFTRTSLCAAARIPDTGDLLCYLKQHGLIHQNNGNTKMQSRVPVARDCVDSYDIHRRQISMYCVSEHLMRWRDDQPHPTKEALFGGPATPTKPTLVRREGSNN